MSKAKNCLILRHLFGMVTISVTISETPDLQCTDLLFSRSFLESIKNMLLKPNKAQHNISEY